MKLKLSVCALLISIQLFGQGTTFFKTTGNKNIHYLEFNGDSVIVYKMGAYFDKAGSGPAIILADTLTLTNDRNFLGKVYALIKKETAYTLQSSKGKEFNTEPENDLDKVNTTLNNAYCLKSYSDLSDQLNKKFPLYHYSFRNGYYAWEKLTNKNTDRHQFIEQVDKEVLFLYDSISRIQTRLSQTTDFICGNAKQTDYSILKDSLSTLPIDYRPQNGYFDTSVYQITKAHPEYFYKLLLDFPDSKSFIYSAVFYQDKEVIKQLKTVAGYDELKKDFFKAYRGEKSIPYKVIGLYAALAGLLTWLILAQ